MMIRFISALAAALILALAPVPVLRAEVADKVVKMPGEHDETNASIARARASLQEFWTAKANPPEGVDGFALKVRVTDGDRIEHFWLADIVNEEQAYIGTITNTPNVVSNVKQGERHKFTADQITDWMFMRDGKIVGNETMRPLLKELAPEEAARFRALLEKP